MAATKHKQLALLIFQNRAPLPLTEEEYKSIILKDIPDTFNVGVLPPLLVDRIRKGSNCLKLACEFSDLDTLHNVMRIGGTLTVKAYAEELDAVLNSSQKHLLSPKLRAVLRVIPRCINLPLSFESQGKTALHKACSKCDVDVVSVLLDFGADPFTLDHFKRTAFYYAWESKKNKEKKIEILMKSLLPQRRLLIFEALSEQAELLEHVTSFFDGSERSSTDSTALHCAVMNRNVDIVVKLLATSTLDPNVQNADGDTALHLAVKSVAPQGDFNIVKILCQDPRVNLSLQNNCGKTPKEIAKAKRLRASSIFLQQFSDSHQKRLGERIEHTRSLLSSIRLEYADGSEHANAEVARLAEQLEHTEQIVKQLSIDQPDIDAVARSLDDDVSCLHTDILRIRQTLEAEKQRTAAEQKNVALTQQHGSSAEETKNHDGTRNLPKIESLDMTPTLKVTEAAETTQSGETGVSETKLESDEHTKLVSFDAEQPSTDVDNLNTRDENEFKLPDSAQNTSRQLMSCISVIDITAATTTSDALRQQAHPDDRNLSTPSLAFEVDDTRQTPTPIPSATTSSLGSSISRTSAATMESARSSLDVVDSRRPSEQSDGILTERPGAQKQSKVNLHARILEKDKRIKELNTKLKECKTQMQKQKEIHKKQQKKLKLQLEKLNKKLTQLRENERNLQEGVNETLSQLEKEQATHAITQKHLELEKQRSEMLQKMFDNLQSDALRTDDITSRRDDIQNRLLQEMNERRTLEKDMIQLEKSHSELTDDLSVTDIKIFQIVSRSMASCNTQKWTFLAKQLFSFAPQKLRQTTIKMIGDQSENESEAGMMLLARWKKVIGSCILGRGEDPFEVLKEALKTVGMPQALNREVDALSTMKDHNEKDLINEVRLMNLSTRIDNDWRQLGVHLSIPYDTLTHLEQAHPTNAMARNMAMLMTWKRNLPPGQQLMHLNQLACALVDVGRRDLTKYTNV